MAQLAPRFRLHAAAERIKLACDVVGPEFAGRHHRYEMSYAGAPFAGYTAESTR